MKNFYWFGLAVVAGSVLLCAAFWTIGSEASLTQVQTWQRLASPGHLSAGHAFLEQNCAACHTAVAGPETGKCIVCHANNRALLERQPTAFHANVGHCAECHHEHLGINIRPSGMDHLALAKIGLRDLRAGNRANSDDAIYERLSSWINQDQATDEGPHDHPSVTAFEATLNCEACHSKKDAHRGFFGHDCVECHLTTQWSIPDFRHPSPSSTDCAQCHQAPPSHFMEHFRMVSQKVACKENANVSQCFMCHQTTSWNDIRGVGWYKHH